MTLFRYKAVAGVIKVLSQQDGVLTKRGRLDTDTHGGGLCQHRAGILHPLRLLTSIGHPLDPSGFLRTPPSGCLGGHPGHCGVWGSLLGPTTLMPGAPLDRRHPRHHLASPGGRTAQVRPMAVGKPLLNSSQLKCCLFQFKEHAVSFKMS